MENKGSSSQGVEQQQQISFAMIHPSSSSSSSLHGSFMKSSKESGAYDLGELDQALFMYLDGQDHSTSAQEQRQTLNIFPSQPMHVEPSTKGGISLASPSSSGSKKSSQQAMDQPGINNTIVSQEHGKDSKAAVTKKEGNRKGMSGIDHEGPKTPDAKMLRRLAQNREAARKSRLRKKVYIQQLETSRIKLSQLEQELQRARAQGILFGSAALIGEQGLPAGAGAVGGLSSDAAMFDMEYARWLEEHHRLMCELRAVVQDQQAPENKLRMFVDSCLAHYDQMMTLKSIIIKSDVFHLISGMWLSPAERCFMWMGGFRPSEIIKMPLRYIEPLTEQQILGVRGLQQSTQETEEALSQGLEALNRSLMETITSDALSYPTNMANYMGQMAVAINKLTTLEGFIRQADNLRQQTLLRLYQILTTRQMARCLLAMAEYLQRLRALSSLWLARPRQE
ncbi:transcription factor TGA2.3 [Canna indica]|uniref:Transcription factor TGA2.3 n=1 Tax=Canna indica TaxID=4628 RepID=A0AAQ3KPS9_9LILI|nr:transcription factor TGA2.3 [Canna indica]